MTYTVCSLAGLHDDGTVPSWDRILNDSHDTTIPSENRERVKNSSAIAGDVSSWTVEDSVVLFSLLLAGELDMEFEVIVRRKMRGGAVFFLLHLKNWELDLGISREMNFPFTNSLWKGEDKEVKFICQKCCYQRQCFPCLLLYLTSLSFQSWSWVCSN